MVALAVSKGTIDQLKQTADVKGTTVDELAEQAIRRFLHDEARRMMRQETEAFRRLHPELLAKYLDEYVAIHQGQVVDHDIDQLALFLRIDAQYPHTPFLIKQVLPSPEEVYTIRSPRFEYE
jgi:hypothetical protein